MKTISTALQNALHDDTLTICDIIQIIRVDGTILYFTDLDSNVLIGGNVYIASNGFNATSIQAALGAGAQTCSYELLLSEDGVSGITRADLHNGLYAFAKLLHSRVDYMNVTAGKIDLLAGNIITSTYGDALTVTLDVTTPMAQTRPICNDVYSQACRYDFGDSDCGVSLDDKVDGPHVDINQTDPQVLVLTPDELSPQAYYNNGFVYFNTGANTGKGFEIETNDYPDPDNPLQTHIHLKVAMNTLALAGDAVLLYPGCDKRIDSGCTYWNNVARFGGEPYDIDQELVTSTNTSAPVDSPTTSSPADVATPVYTAATDEAAAAQAASTDWLYRYIPDGG